MISHRNDSASLRDFSGSLWNTDAVNGSQDFVDDVKFGTGQNEWSFTGGVTSTTLGNDDILRGFDKFEDKDNIEVDFLIAPQRIADADATVVVNDLVGTGDGMKKIVSQLHLQVEMQFVLLVQPLQSQHVMTLIPKVHI